ncbi:MAG: hypothetical protein V1804_00985 [Patescibacteria group bacterium]
MDFSKFKNNYLDPKKIMGVCSAFWNNHSKLIFAIFSFAIIFLGTFFWYRIIYKSDWSSEEKEQYKNSQNKEVQLKDKELKLIIEEIDRKKSVYGEPAKEYKNIFAPYIGKNDLEVGINNNVNP